MLNVFLLLSRNQKFKRATFTLSRKHGILNNVLIKREVL